MRRRARKASSEREEHARPVLGITGTGGAGKTRSPTSWCAASASTRATTLGIAVLSVDPTRRKTGGALLGDRIRMNAIHGRRVFMRSLATREAGSELSGRDRRRHRRVQGGAASTS